MKELEELLTEAKGLVNRSIQDIQWGHIGLKEVEERVVELLNRAGGLLVDQVVEGVSDPVLENCVWVEGKRAIYKDSGSRSDLSTDSVRRSRGNGEGTRLRKSGGDGIHLMRSWGLTGVVVIRR